MRPSPFMKAVNILCLFLGVYIIIFVTLHFLQPSFDELLISITSSSTRLESRNVTVTNPSNIKSYYLLVYEEGDSENWLYFSSQATTMDSTILKQFLPSTKNNYILLDRKSVV